MLSYIIRKIPKKKIFNFKYPDRMLIKNVQICRKTMKGIMNQIKNKCLFNFTIHQIRNGNTYKRANIVCVKKILSQVKSVKKVRSFVAKGSYVFWGVALVTLIFKCFLKRYFIFSHTLLPF